MEFNYNKKLNIEIANNSQKILPVPIKRNPTPNVEKPDYYGKSPYPMSYQVSSRKNDYLQYDNILDTSPRDQLNLMKKNTIEPFCKDSCYMVDNKRQGVIGLMCDQDSNGNNVRGNTFGLDYDWNLINEIKKKEYTVEQPVQQSMLVKNPLIVNDQSQFYPNQHYYHTRSKDYNTYPKNNNYNEKGKPTYVYPHKILNNIENFIDYDQNKNMMNLILVVLTILVLLVIIYFTKR